MQRAGIVRPDRPGLCAQNGTTCVPRLRECRRGPVRGPMTSNPQQRVSGLTLILIATGVAGVTSYVVTWLVPFSIGVAGYALFAIFWSFTYLVVGALFGIQQEVTRGTRGVDPLAQPVASRARSFGLIAGASVFTLIVGSAPLWVHAVFPVGGWALVWPLAFGTASFVMVAVLCGSLYGIAEWVPIAVMMIVDAVLRLIAIVVVLAFTADVVALAWAVALPFPLTLVLVWPFVRRSVVGRIQLDVGYRALTWNVARTILAAASTGVMVSGFPLVLGLTSAAEPAAVVGLYILAITLTRAPLIVIAMSLQSYLIVTFRDSPESFWRTLLRMQSVVAAGGAVLAALGWMAGPPVFSFLFPRETAPEGWLVAVLVVSSALVAAMCVNGPAVLAGSQHLVYSAGWVVGAVATIAALMLPLDFSSRTIIALFAGPLCGLVVYSAYLVRLRVRTV